MGRIDVHAHDIPDFYREAAAAAGRRPAVSSGLPAWSPQRALEVMDANGIASAILSVSAPGVHFGDDGAARKLARRCNEHKAELARRWPGRFGGFAALPLPDVPGALDEIDYALDSLGLDGIGLFSSYDGRYLGDPLFDPILERLDARAAVAFVHPVLNPLLRELRIDLPAFVVEYVFDTTRAAANLLFSGALDRFPNIRFVLAHGGGTLPFLTFRLAQSPLIDPQRLGAFDPQRVAQLVRRFYFDTALVAHPAPLAGLDAIDVGDRVLFGSDWPFAPAAVTATTVANIPDDGRLEGNALGLFPRLSAKAAR